MNFPRSICPMSLGCIAVVLAFVGGPLYAQTEKAEQRPPSVSRLFNYDFAGRSVEYKDARTGDEFFPVMVNHFWGHMNQRGELIIYPSFDWTDYEYEGIIRVVVKGQTGYIEKTGEWFIEPVYKFGDRFAEGRAIVGDGEHVGFIDKRKELIVPVKLDGALRFKDGYAAVQVGRNCGFIDKSGNASIRPSFARVRSFHDGYAMAQSFNDNGEPGAIGFIDKTGRYRFIDKTGNLNDLGDMCDGLARAKYGRQWGYIDKSGNIRIKAIYEDARDFVDGLAAVKRDGKWGYIDKRGGWQFEPVLQDADDFDDTFAMYVRDDLYGYTNRNGSQGIKAQFINAEPFMMDRARVYLDDYNFGYIDQAGRVIWDPRPALNGILDLSTRGQIVARDGTSIATNGGPAAKIKGTRVLPAPPERPPLRVPYEPEYLYDEVLPRPEQ